MHRIWTIRARGVIAAGLFGSSDVLLDRPWTPATQHRLSLYMLVRRGVVSVSVFLVVACRPSQQAADSTFAEVQRRGANVMGVDQYTSKHVFEDLPDGGRIVLDRDDAADTAAVRAIQAHMLDIATAFSRGDFTAPGLVHAQQVPGTKVMMEKRAMITYQASGRPRGAEVRILTTDAVAIAAVHEFLRFQRSDHRAAGHEAH